MSFDSIGDSPVGKVVRKFGNIVGDETADPLHLFKKKDDRLEVPESPPTRVEADVKLAKLDARERRRRSGKSPGSSSGLGTPQLSQPTLSDRLG